MAPRLGERPFRNRGLLIRALGLFGLGPLGLLRALELLAGLEGQLFGGFERLACAEDLGLCYLEDPACLKGLALRGSECRLGAYQGMARVPLGDVSRPSRGRKYAYS